MLFNIEYLSYFLTATPHITNKLACLLRELQELQVTFAAFAAIGVQLIEPCFAVTIKEGATHSSLKQFYQNLFTSLSTYQVNQDFLKFNKPAFLAYLKICARKLRKATG